MGSIDDLFKPASASGKRKLEVTHDPGRFYKSSRTDENGTLKSNGKHAHIDDEANEDNQEAGPELPPDLEDAPPDEDGRFFGGGITQNTSEVLDFIDGREQDASKPEAVDSAWLRRTALSFEKKIGKNTEHRARFENEPKKFMASEADLDAEIKSLSVLAEYPKLYPEFVELGCVASLVSLLSHDNTDIAIDAIEVISELTDDDLDAEPAAWDVLVDALLEADLLSLLHENLMRMDESIESDRSGVYHILSVLENLSSRQATVANIVRDTKLLPWLLARVGRKETSTTQNKQYASELLAVFLSSSESARDAFIGASGIDTVLQLLSPYRRKDPQKDSEEEEVVENLFDCITCCVDMTLGKAKFVEAEGIELCLIMLREGGMSKTRALRLLDHVTAGSDGGSACEVFVDKAGLKVLFGLFAKSSDKQIVEHTIGVLASLLRSLQANSAHRIRLLAKFEEKDYRAILKVLRIMVDMSEKVAKVDAVIDSEKASLDPDEVDRNSDTYLLRRLDSGLYALQTSAIILAWLVAEDAKMKDKIIEGLKAVNKDLSALEHVMQDQLKIISADANDEDPILRDILNTLVSFMQ